MSVDIDVSTYCDGCHRYMDDSDYIYCKGCHEPDVPWTAARDLFAEQVKEWFDNNELILTKEQYAFGQIMLDSVRFSRMPLLK